MRAGALNKRNDGQTKPLSCQDRLNIALNSGAIITTSAITATATIITMKVIYHRCQNLHGHLLGLTTLGVTLGYAALFGACAYFGRECAEMLSTSDNKPT